MPQYRLVKANKDPEILIKEGDQDSWHVQFKRVTGTLLNPEVMLDVQIYSRKDFELLNKAVDKQGIYITGYHEMRVVHDPVLRQRLEDEAFAKSEQEKAAKEKREKAKPGPKPTNKK